LRSSIPVTASPSRTGTSPARLAASRSIRFSPLELGNSQASGAVIGGGLPPKKQQMRWSPRGAHLLLQVRTRVLNNDLAGGFARWYPGPASSGQPLDVAA